MNNVTYTHICVHTNNRARVICSDRVTETQRYENDPESKPTLVVLVLCEDNEEYIRLHTQREFEEQYKKIDTCFSCEVDDPVYVKDTNLPYWYKRHFAGFNEYGQPTFWVNGGTSFTTKSRSVAIKCYPANQVPEEVLKYTIS